MTRVEVITKHKQGEPDGKTGITWLEYFKDANIESESEMHDHALALLRGEFMYINGYTYFLTGINLRD